MAIFKPYRVQSSQLDSLPKVEGQFIVVEDTQEMYFDKSTTQRIAVGGLTDVNVSIVNGVLTLTDQNGNTLSTASVPRVIEAVSWNDETLPDTAAFDTYSKSALDTMFQSIDTSLDNVTLTQDATNGHILTFTNANGNTTIITIPDNNSITGVKGDNESSYRTGNVNITKGNIGLGNVENKSSATIRGEITSANVTTALGYTPLNNALKGANNGVAELGADGKVPSAQLPSYVDDVLEYNGQSNFPATGETGKIYVDTSTNKTYRWSGSAYTEISASLALGETSSTAYRGDRGKIAYDHSQSTHARTDATKTEASATNGNIKINGTETTVYTHPTTTAAAAAAVKVGKNAAGHVVLGDALTKSDIGLGNVGNFKAVSTAASQGLTDTEKSNARTNIGAGTSSLTLGTSSSTAYRGDRGNTAYAHAVTNKGAAFTSGLYKITTNAEGHVTAATAVAKSDITGLGIPAQDTTYATGNTSTAGITKLYTATGQNTDGAMTQKAVTDLIGDITTLMAAL